MKQITIYLGLISLLSLAASCNRVTMDGQENTPSDQISFAPKVVYENINTEEEPWSKGKPLNSLVDILPSMGMFCYLTDGLWAADGATAKPTKMNNVALYSSKDGSGNVTWSYEAGNEHTWQGVSYGTNVTFFGYSPVATAENGLSITPDFSADGVGLPTVHYKVLDDIVKQPDLHIAVPVKDMMRTTNPVQLTYRRALADIGIIITGNGQKVNGVYISGVSRSGDISLDVSPVPTTPLVWTNLGAASTAPADRLNIPLPKPAPIEVGSEAGSMLMLTDQVNGYLMMIPQTLSDDACIVVDLEGEPDRSYHLKTSKIQEWLPGQMFQYTLKLNESSIIVEPDNWMDVMAEASSIEVTVSSLEKRGYGWDATIEGTGLSMSLTSSMETKPTKVTISWTENKGRVEPGKRHATVIFKPKEVPNMYGVYYGSAEFHTSQLGAGPDWIEYNGVKWAKGNLIADGARGCKIGDPTDGGLYFRFGSLVGLKGGSTGDGRGRTDPSFNETYWNKADTFDPDNEIAVYPAEMLDATGSGKPTVWNDPAIPTSKIGPTNWYFNHVAHPFNDENTRWLPNLESIRKYTGIVEGKWAKIGVGDPCTYYLGADWQTPTQQNWHSLCNYAEKNPWFDPSLVGAEIESDVAKKENIYFAHRTICIPISGARGNSAGKFTGLTRLEAGGSPYTQYWATEVYGDLGAWTFWYQWNYSKNDDMDIFGGNRTAAFPVRCVYNK